MSVNKKYDYIWKYNEYTEQNEVQMFADIAHRDGVRSINGLDDDWYAYIDNNKYLRFVNWDKTGTSAENERKIFVGLEIGDESKEILIYSNRDSTFDPSHRQYCIAYSTEGDWSLQVGQGSNTKEDLEKVSPIFAVVVAIDPLTNHETWGIYVPKLHGGAINSAKNAATKYFVTDDTEYNMANINGESTNDLNFVIKENAKSFVLVPMAAVGSEYISKYSRVIMIGSQTDNGPITASGKSYNLVVNLALPNT